MILEAICDFSDLFKIYSFRYNSSFSTKVKIFSWDVFLKFLIFEISIWHILSAIPRIEMLYTYRLSTYSSSRYTADEYAFNFLPSRVYSSPRMSA